MTPSVRWPSPSVAQSPTWARTPHFVKRSEQKTPTVAETVATPPAPVILPPLLEVECDQPMKAVSMKQPEYPETARQPYVGKGTIELELTISGSGVVADVKVVKSLNPFWDPRFVKAARGWVFEPCMNEGEPRIATKVVSITLTQQ